MAKIMPSSQENSIALLGSTGSIGRQSLEVASSLGFRVLALSADKNIKLLEEQVREFKPAVAAVFDEGAAQDFKARIRDTGVRVCSGSEGIIEAACVEGADTVVTAVVGMAGLAPTLAAIKLGRRIALANKETLVCAGELVMNSAKKSGSRIVPIDSEHAAVMQCLAGDTASNVKRIILTASGGAFRGMKRAELSKVTAEMALRHPTWSMGRKITIDSATLMNKGFEVIEAVHLFGVSSGMIDVVIHPESIIHSMVEFEDCSVMAQLAQPDMRLPIQNALTFPKREPTLAPTLDFTRIPALTFEEPDMEAFPCLRLALDTVGIKGTACSVLNGANEAAVDLFLQGKLGFYGIHESICAALGSIGNVENPSIEDIIEAGEEAKRIVYGQVTGNR